MILQTNELETARFGILCARLSDPKAPLQAVNADAAKNGVRMITTRVEAADVTRIHALEADGYRLMDTLVYYSRLLDDLPKTDGAISDVKIHLASSDDASAVAEVARAAFQGYFGHYHADPRLNDAAADAAYVEWAETSIVWSSHDRPALIATHRGRVVGFLTLRLNSTEEIEIVLNAVHPSSQRAGVYSALVSQAMLKGHAMGARLIKVSTQITNAPVQRVWAGRGFVFDHAIYTLHKWL